MKELVEAVKRALDALCDEPDEREWGDPEWTDRVKSAVAGCDELKDLKAYAYGVEHAAGKEWLYDLTCLDYSVEQDRLYRAVLVLECEWDPSLSGINYDFQKLLLARADLRLMVFQAKDAAGYEHVTSDLIDQVESFQQSSQGDRYLLSGWLADGRRFRHCFHVHGDG